MGGEDVVFVIDVSHDALQNVFQGDEPRHRSGPVAHQSQVLVATVIRRGKAPEVITDLSATELAKFGKNNRITADDILEMHNFLKDFDGDFGRIFSKRGPRK